LNPALAAVPDPEVSDRPRRRTYTAEYKLAVLRELDACTEPGQLGAILRREGLYSSNITEWRRKREAGELRGLGANKNGRPQRIANPLAAEVSRLEREIAGLNEELRKARIIIDVQKKLSEILNVPMESSSRNSACS
jgi:transposase-like protein